MKSYNYADNVKYVYDGSVFTAESPIVLPLNGSALYYRAVYPYATGRDNTFTFAVNVYQNYSNNYTLSDLMTAETNALTVENPHLEFNHRLSNIIINIQYEERPAGAEQLIFNEVETAAYVNLNNNTYEPTGSTSSVTAASNGTNSYRAILPPQTILAGTRLVTWTIGDYAFAWEPEETLEWRSGKQYTYNLVVNKIGKVSFTTTINPWDDESSNVEKVVPPAILDEMEPYIPIHRGTTPPNIEGTYLMDNSMVVYSSDGGYEPGKTGFAQQMLTFMNQNNTTLTVDYYEITSRGSEYVGNGSFISGSGNDFTVCFDTKGHTTTKNGVYIEFRTALVISGTKEQGGIRNLRYAFVMVEKGDDPYNEMIDPGVFRIFQDSDELASVSNGEFSVGNTRGELNTVLHCFESVRAVK